MHNFLVRKHALIILINYFSKKQKSRKIQILTHINKIGEFEMTAQWLKNQKTQFIILNCVF